VALDDRPIGLPGHRPHLDLEHPGEARHREALGALALHLLGSHLHAVTEAALRAEAVPDRTFLGQYLTGQLWSLVPVVMGYGLL
jgi:hypothetical protein